jgi:WD40 repeat protein
MLILEGHSRQVLSVAYAPDSRTLASGGVDQSVRLWDLATGRTTLTITDVGGPVLSLAFAPDASRLAVGTTSRVTLWDLPAREPLAVLRGERGGTYTVAFFPDNRRVALCGYLDPHITVRDLQTEAVLTVLQGHQAGVLALTHAAASPALVSGGGFINRGELMLWNTETFSLQFTFGDWTDIPLPTYYYDAMGRVIARSHSRRVQVAHAEAVYAAAISPDGRLLASGSKDRQVKLWQVGKELPLARLGVHAGTVVAVSFTPDGWGLLSADASGTVCLWDVETRRLRHSWDWQVGQLRSVVFAPNGMTAAAGGNRDVIVWDMDDLDR